MGRRPKPQPKKPARPILPMLKKKRGRPRKILGEEKTTIEAKIEALLKRGRERGFVTYTEILGSFPNIEDDISFLEELYRKFEDASIDVLEAKELIEVPEEGAKVPGRKKRDRKSTR